MTHFIMLPDGTIINVAHVRRISTIMTTYNADQSRNQLTRIDTGSDVDQEQDYPMDFHDPGGKIYAWFADKAERVGGES